MSVLAKRYEEVRVRVGNGLKKKGVTESPGGGD